MLTTDPVALDQWYTLGAVSELPQGAQTARLLGADLVVQRDAETFTVSANGRRLPTDNRYGYLWTTLGTPTRPLFAVPEWDEPDRRAIYCGSVRVRASGLRVVENFLDLAHFPYVHTEILGTESHPEVERYQVEHREADDEIWATKCTFFQPKAAASAEGGQMSQYMYRVMSNPFLTMLYKTPPTAPNRWDVIALFVQPVEEDYSIAHPFMLLIDDVSSEASLISFQQMIFLQDRIVLENQRPKLLPLQPGRETPTRGDLSSVVYRRWLKERGLRFGVEEPVRLAHD